MPLEKALLGALGRLLRLDPEVLRLVAASVINYNLYIYISICLYIYISIYQYVYMSIYLYIDISIYLNI